MAPGANAGAGKETAYCLSCRGICGCVAATTMAGFIDETRQMIAMFTTIGGNSKGQKPGYCHDTHILGL